MKCEKHGCDLPCPWPECRAKAGISDHIHDGQTARHFVCGPCRMHGWLWVPITEPMPPIDHVCKEVARATG